MSKYTNYQKLAALGCLVGGSMFIAFACAKDDLSKTDQALGYIFSGLVTGTSLLGFFATWYFRLEAAYRVSPRVQNAEFGEAEESLPDFNGQRLEEPSATPLNDFPLNRFPNQTT